MVPIGVIQLHETHAALDQPPASKQLLANDGLPGSAPYISRVPLSSSQVDQFRRTRLHPIGHLVGRDARGDFRIAGVGQARAEFNSFSVSRTSRWRWSLMPSAGRG